MDNNTESSNSEIQEVSEVETSSDPKNSKTDQQESISVLRDFDIQSPTGSMPSHVHNGGELTSWKPVSNDEEMRRRLAFWSLGLLFAWLLLIGPVIYLITRDGWLLTVPTGILAWTVKKVFNYYFRLM